MPFNICLVGCGGIAVQGHGPMMMKYAAMREGVRLAACCDLAFDRAQAFAAAYGFSHAYSDLSKMMDEMKPDGVLLAVPVEHTAGLAVGILERRIPLLLEKPPGVTVDEGKRIAEAAVRAGVPASVAFNRRTMPLIEALKHELDGAHSEIVSIGVEMCRAQRIEPDFSTTAIHEIDLARYLCGSDYSRAQFVYRTHNEAQPAADIFMLAQTESGAVVRVDILPMSGLLTERIAVRLHERSYYAELPIFSGADVPGKIVCYEGNKATKIIYGASDITPSEANGFLGEHTAFFDNVREGKEPGNSVSDCLQSLEVACCMRERQSQYIKTA